MAFLSRLAVHPVKSMRGIQLSHAQVSLSGLAFDRIFMVTETDGTFITARQYPQMVLFTPAIMHDGLHLSAPDGSSVVVRYSDFSADARRQKSGATILRRLSPRRLLTSGSADSLHVTCSCAGSALN